MNHQKIPGVREQQLSPIDGKTYALHIANTLGVATIAILLLAAVFTG